MNDCIFCKIAAGEIGKLVYEDDYVAAFDDLNPVAETHVLIVPKKHIASLNEIDAEEHGAMAGHALAAAAKIAAERGLKDGYRLVSNCGAHGGQTVMHLHFHLVGGRAMGWPPFPEE